jgi:hypothetical protein
MGARNWQEAFIACLEKDGRESICADRTGVDRKTIWYAKRRDPEFRQRVERAIEKSSGERMQQSLSRLRRASFDD